MLRNELSRDRTKENKAMGNEMGMMLANMAQAGVIVLCLTLLAMVLAAMSKGARR